MRISVVIPTLNAGSQLAALLERLNSQVPAAPDEIILVDSGSSDGTCALAHSAGARVVEWTQAFDHGLARDAGIAAASGDIIVLTVQDALPASDDWLAKISRHFQDAAVAGVSTRQIPPDGGPLELQIKAQLESTGAAGQPQRICLAEHPDYARYSAAQKLELYRFDNVCSAVRRSVWEKIPFGACRYAEDFQWARRALEAGHTLVRDPSAPVIHAHRRSFAYEFRRALLDAWVLDEAFGYRYRFSDKLNRVRHFGNGAGLTKTSFLLKCGAVKTYSAHVLARGTYGAYRRLLKPLGLGAKTLAALTNGI